MRKRTTTTTLARIEYGWFYLNLYFEIDSIQKYCKSWEGKKCLISMCMGSLRARKNSVRFFFCVLFWGWPDSRQVKTALYIRYLWYIWNKIIIQKSRLLRNEFMQNATEGECEREKNVPKVETECCDCFCYSRLFACHSVDSKYS